MMITIATHCDDRKEMVRKLSAHMNTPSVYLRAPTYGFVLGEITVNRDASVSGDREALIPVAQFLLDNGYIQEMPSELTEEANAPGAETISEPVDETDPASETYTNCTDRPEGDAGMPDSEIPTDETETPQQQPDAQETEAAVPVVTSVRIHESDWTADGMRNFMNMLYAHQWLINWMLRMDRIRIYDEFIQELKSSTLDTVDDFETLVHDSIRDGMIRGISIEGSTVVMELPYPPGSRHEVHFTRLISACIKLAKASQFILAKKETQEPNKYIANAWINRLGLRGPENRELRHVLMAHLPGYAAFQNKEKMREFRRKYAELRRLRHRTGEEVCRHE